MLLLPLLLVLVLPGPACRSLPEAAREGQEAQAPAGNVLLLLLLPLLLMMTMA